MNLCHWSWRLFQHLGITKSEASGACYNKGVTQCPNAADRVFFQECGAVPFTLGECECCKCCMQTYGSPDVCWAVVEGSDNHCHCYKHVWGLKPPCNKIPTVISFGVKKYHVCMWSIFFCFQIKPSTQSLSLLATQA